MKMRTCWPAQRNAIAEPIELRKMVFRGFSSEYSERSGIELTKINRVQRKLLAFLLKFKRKNLSKLNRRIFNLSSS